MKWISVCMLYKSGNCDASELICLMSSWRIDKCLKIFNTLFSFLQCINVYWQYLFSSQIFSKVFYNALHSHKVFGKTFTLQILYSFSPNRIEGIIQVEDQANNNEHFSHCPVYPDHRFTLSSTSFVHCSIMHIAHCTSCVYFTYYVSSGK